VSQRLLGRGERSPGRPPGEPEDLTRLLGRSSPFRCTARRACHPRPFQSPRNRDTSAPRPGQASSRFLGDWSDDSADPWTNSASPVLPRLLTVGGAGRLRLRAKSHRRGLDGQPSGCATRAIPPPSRQASAIPRWGRKLRRRAAAARAAIGGGIRPPAPPWRLRGPATGAMVGPYRAWPRTLAVRATRTRGGDPRGGPGGEACGETSSDPQGRLRSRRRRWSGCCSPA
jgi:hypothetical protein